MTIHISTSQITIDALIENVWDALTKPELVKMWQYGSDLTTDWTVGSPIKFHSEYQGQIYEQWGIVLAIEPLATIKYSLFAPRPDLEDIPENYFTMTYALKELDDQIELIFTQEDPRDQLEGQADNVDEEANPILVGLKQLIEGSKY